MVFPPRLRWEVAFQRPIQFDLNFLSKKNPRNTSLDSSKVTYNKSLPSGNNILVIISSESVICFVFPVYASLPCWHINREKKKRKENALKCFACACSILLIGSLLVALFTQVWQLFSKLSFYSQLLQDYGNLIWKMALRVVGKNIPLYLSYSLFLTGRLVLSFASLSQHTHCTSLFCFAAISANYWSLHRLLYNKSKSLPEVPSHGTDTVLLYDSPVDLDQGIRLLLCCYEAVGGGKNIA